MESNHVDWGGGHSAEVGGLAFVVLIRRRGDMLDGAEGNDNQIGLGHAIPDREVGRPVLHTLKVGRIITL